MALNCAMLSQTREPIPLPNELTINTIDSGAEVVLHIPDNDGSQKMKATGRVWLTDQRILFTSSPDSTFDSLSIPLPSILSTQFHQPTFSSNYLYFEIKPSEGGGLTTGAYVELRFRNRAMFEFVAILEKTRERAIYMKRQAAQEEDGLPTYTLPEESTAVTMVNGTPVENPPEYGASASATPGSSRST